jgi:hypothetical protein
LARSYISPLRRGRSYRRRQGTRQPRSVTLIVCEGDTERRYFQTVRTHFGLTNAEVVVADSATESAPISVVKYAESRAREQGGYDHIFCVFDRDGHESFERARARIRQLSNRSRNPLPIHEAVSVPCYEIWVLLHFDQSDAPFQDCDEVVSRIRRHIPGYSKTDPNLPRALLPRIDTALANAQWLRNREGLTNENPSTAVHVIVQHLKGISIQ